jgi:hypothetical protein
MTALIVISLVLIIGGLVLALVALVTLPESSTQTVGSDGVPLDAFETASAQVAHFALAIGGIAVVTMGIVAGFFTLIAAAINSHATALAEIRIR